MFVLSDIIGTYDTGMRKLEYELPVHTTQDYAHSLILTATAMVSSTPSSNAPSRLPTPNPLQNPRFTSQASTAEDLLKSQTVGLVHLSDFRKRRAEALEQKEREAQAATYGRYGSITAPGSATPSTGYVPDGRWPKFFLLLGSIGADRQSTVFQPLNRRKKSADKSPMESCRSG